MDAKKELVGPIRTAVNIAVNLLVMGEYEALEALTRGRLLSAPLLRRAVADYRHQLVSPPESALTDLDVVQAPDIDPPTFHVVFPLWTEDEGESDLTLELRLVEAYPNAFETEITSLHVR